MANQKVMKLGRSLSPDARDQNYLIKNNFTFVNRLGIKKKFWDPNGWWGNQGDLPYCVGYAWAHWIEDGPITHPGKKPNLSPITIYENAQKLDEWPGEGYPGTSVRGGLKYLKQIGVATSYYWAFDVDTIINYVLQYGPVVVGTDWYTGMFYPDRRGVIKIGGNIEGGHAYLINGVDTTTQQFRIKNSWGWSWGKGGMASISFSDMSQLILQEGEAAIAIEKRGKLF